MRVFECTQMVELRNRDLAEEARKMHNLLENTTSFTAVLLGAEMRFAMANVAYRRLTATAPWWV